MKNLKNNKKGFTLIELLAVIVILAILVAVAVPAVMRYLSQARRGTFASNANEAISSVRTDTTMTGLIGTVYYDLDNVNNLLQKKLSNSPYGPAFTATSYVKVEIATDGTATYSICLADASKNGIPLKEEKDVTESNVNLGNVECTLPTDARKACTFSDGTTTKYLAEGLTDCGK